MPLGLRTYAIPRNFGQNMRMTVEGGAIHAKTRREVAVGLVGGAVLWWVTFFISIRLLGQENEGAARVAIALILIWAVLGLCAAVSSKRRLGLGLGLGLSGGLAAVLLVAALSFALPS